MTAGHAPRLLLTPGEPAGIGPDLTVSIAQREWPARLVAIADPDLLAARARITGQPLRIHTVDTPDAAPAHRAGTLCVWPVRLRAAVRPGHLDAANAGYVLDTLRQAACACLDGRGDAIVTAPVHKGIINDAGIRFTGHTEFLAERCGSPLPVMMLSAPLNDGSELRVALVTTHLPLREVPNAITPERLTAVARILAQDLKLRFGIERPRILVSGLNPHAGESGHLGREEIDTIAPTLEQLRREGLDLHGPLPADTLFTPHHLQGADAVLAMYHDQGLTVLKFAGFGRAVNLTLGLPIVRTSVDHGTALDLAGSGRADSGSFEAAIALAIRLSRIRQPGAAP